MQPWAFSELYPTVMMSEQCTACCSRHCSLVESHLMTAVSLQAALAHSLQNPDSVLSLSSVCGPGSSLEHAATSPRPNQPRISHLFMRHPSTARHTVAAPGGQTRGRPFDTTVRDSLYFPRARP